MAYNKSLLIISPHFPPINGADMHRVRQSIGYFEQFGYIPTVVCVEPSKVETQKDMLLLKTIPENIAIIKVNAFSVSITRKFGLGALALRSIIFYFLKVNQLLKTKKIDLIYFSTTAFPVLVLGRYWKWKFGVPYIIDMQDPWHSDYYKNKPKNEQPAKYWFSYRLNKFLEPIAMKNVNGIVSVSAGYCEMLQNRYANIKPKMCTVIPFGAFEKDYEHIKTNNIKIDKTIIRYIGRGGADMKIALQIIFSAFKIGLLKYEKLFSSIKIEFIGTSYAHTNGQKTIEPLAIEMGLQDYVEEYPERISYFDTLQKLNDADILIMPGSDDINYTASKLYPYILSKKPILAVFSNTSSVIQIIEATNAGEYVSFDSKNLQINQLANELVEKWKKMLEKIPYTPDTNWVAFEPYTAKEMTRKQAAFFDSILSLV